MNNNIYRQKALSSFDNARRQARRDQIGGMLTGRDTRLLPFDEIRTELRQRSPLYKGIQEVPLDVIIGSVGRYTELTRHFLPLNDSMRERWVGITTLAYGQGWLPIELIKVSDIYFVKDGHHRVSAARQLDAPSVEAHVWEHPDELPIGPEDKIEDILIRFGERNFMKRTGLDKSHPDHGIRFTTAGRYAELTAQIYSLQGKLSIIDGEEMDWATAVAAWYEMVYQPTIQIIHDSTLLEDFPGRTEADLFVWMSLMRRPLQEEYGEVNNLADLVQLLTDKYKESGLGKAARQVRRILGQEALPLLEEPPEEPSDTELSESGAS